MDGLHIASGKMRCRVLSQELLVYDGRLHGKLEVITKRLEQDCTAAGVREWLQTGRLTTLMTLVAKPQKEFVGPVFRQIKPVKDNTARSLEC